MSDSRFDEFEYLRFERDGDVLVVTVDKPEDHLNKVDAQMHHELTGLFKVLREEREARAVLLAGTDRAFTAGGDFAWFPRFAEPGYAADIRIDGKSIVWNMLDVHLPIVCAVTGQAIALEELRYWSVAKQEPYASAEASTRAALSKG